MTLLLDTLFSSVALGHLIVDMINGQRLVLLTYLAVKLGMNNTLLGWIASAYVWTGSASQPIFGWLVDRFGQRRVAALGILWQAVLFSLAMLLPGNWALVALIASSLGSAAFHPAGATQATLSGRSRLSGRETTAASVFFFFGQFGYFLGPMLGGSLLQHFGTPGLLALAVVAVPLGLNVGWQMRSVPVPQRSKSKVSRSKAGLQVRLSFLVFLALVAALQAAVQQNMITFFPKYIADMHLSAGIYGSLAGLFVGGSATGGVIGGWLADHYSKRPVAFTALLLAGLPIVVISLIGWTPWLYVVVPLAGALSGAVHSILVVTAQRAMPAGMGFASGLTMGFIFSAGAVGTLLCGPLADARGFPFMFQVTAGLALTAAVMTLFWPREPSHAQTEPQVEMEK
jgi:FSR family fosmidomycin resistance protein-like MFS transporter